jgi:hypothetical protein
MRVWLDWWRHAVVTTKAESQKDSADIFGEAKPLLSDRGKELQRDELIQGLLALPSESAPTNLGTELGQRVNGIQLDGSTRPSAMPGLPITWIALCSATLCPTATARRRSRRWVLLCRLRPAARSSRRRLCSCSSAVRNCARRKSGRTHRGRLRVLRPVRRNVCVPRCEARHHHSQHQPLRTSA